MKALIFFMLLALSVRADKPNFLFIAVDDMRPDLNCYGNSMIHSPNIDSLAQKGVLFKRAYVNIAVCNPSRASMMTGLYPDSIKVWDLRVHFREAYPEVITLPQHLRKHGYYAVGMGKVYHNPTPDPQSWSEAVQYPKGVKNAYTKKVREEIKAADKALPQGHHYKGNLRGAAASPNVNEDINTWDGAQTEVAVQTLKRLAQKKEPFFMAMGYVRPHLPFVAPKKYWDLYNRDKIPLAKNRFMPQNGYPQGIGSNYEMRHYYDMMNFPKPADGEVSPEIARKLLHGYYACISQVDALIGRLLKTLKEEGLEDNTVIIFWSDHGWKLGEHNGWSKMTNHEIDTRIPMIVYDPRAKAKGQQSNCLVESVDIFPTVCELAGIPQANGLEGKSFKKLLDEPDSEFKDAVFSQFIQPYQRKPHMGYAVRTENYRYIEWRDIKTGKISFQEIYDQKKDPQENKNIYDSADQNLKEQLQKRLHQWNKPKKMDLTPVVRSIQNGPRCEVKVKNTLKTVVDIYHINHIGARKRVAKLQPGTATVINSYTGHAFVIEAIDGTLHRIIYAGYPKTEIEL